VIKFGEYRVIGKTRDDAAGEAFDKVAKIMGLGYPGGAELDKLAQQGDANYHRFPRSVLKDSYDFSYSGLKTAVSLYIEGLPFPEFEHHKADIAASFQEAAVAVLIEKTVRAARELGVRHVTLSGGVAANSRLRVWLAQELERNGRRLFFPPMAMCTDNAAMIAAAGYFRFKKQGAGDFAADAVPYLQLG